MTNTEIVIAMYRPKAGKQDEVFSIARKHYLLLRENGFTSDRRAFVAEAEDGTLIEVFEWASPEKVKEAHEHPEVLKLWDEMAKVADFLSLDQLSEAKKPFPHFKRICS